MSLRERSDGFTDPVETVLERLDRVRRTRDGWSASCPSSAHRRGDKSPSLSVGRGADGKALLWCGAGCDLERDILPPIGLEIQDLFPPRPEPLHNRRRRKREKFALPPEVALQLLSSDEFSEVWAMAFELATLPKLTAQREIVGSWDYIASLCDAGLLARTADIIRAAAIAEYGDAQDFTPRWSEELGTYVESDGLERCVARLRRHATKRVEVAA